MKDNPLLDKSLLFAARIIKLHKYLITEKKESKYQFSVFKFFYDRSFCFFIKS